MESIVGELFNNMKRVIMFGSWMICPVIKLHFVILVLHSRKLADGKEDIIDFSVISIL